MYADILSLLIIFSASNFHVNYLEEQEVLAQVFVRIKSLLAKLILILLME